jgi:hypothetical protein
LRLRRSPALRLDSLLFRASAISASSILSFPDCANFWLLWDFAAIEPGVALPDPLIETSWLTASREL